MFRCFRCFGCFRCLRCFRCLMFFWCFRCFVCSTRNGDETHHRQGATLERCGRGVLKCFEGIYNHKPTATNQQTTSNNKMSNPQMTTMLSRTNFKKIVKLPPRKHPKQPIDTYAIRSDYRQRKSELVAEMLFELWDKEPSEYDLESVVKQKWKQNVAPLVSTGVEAWRLRGDMEFYYND